MRCAEYHFATPNRLAITLTGSRPIGVIRFLPFCYLLMLVHSSNGKIEFHDYYPRTRVSTLEGVFVNLLGN
jgi:hypothetical protein